MPEIIFENSGWWLIPIALAAAGGAWLLYRNGGGFNRLQSTVLFLVRFLIFFFLGFLLLSPLFKITERKLEKPILVWLEDHSGSILAGTDSVEVQEGIESLKSILPDLEEKYEIRKFDFSNLLHNSGDSFNYPETDISAALQDSRERFYNQNVGALVLVSDGIYNQGGDPAYTAGSLPYPVFAIGLGDTTIPRDLFIDRIIRNDVSYINNRFPVEIYVKARQLANESYVAVVTDDKGREVFRRSIPISGNDHFDRIDFFMEAKETGLQKYQVQLITDSREANKSNNRQTFTVEVIGDRKKVALVGSAPHPDMAAIAEALKGVDKYEVTTLLSASKTDVKDQDLIILHNPGKNTLNDLWSDDKAFWIIQGEKTDPGALMRITGVRSGARGFEETSITYAGNFDLFKVSDDEIDFFNDLPPLFSPFGKPGIDGQPYVLFFKKVGAITTEDPSWFFKSKTLTGGIEQRTAFTLGTGIWRWRIHNYRETKEHTEFDDLVRKTVQYLSAGGKRDRFDVDIANRFSQNENIKAEARLFNKSLELTNAPEVGIAMTDQEGNNFEFTFSKAQSTYRLNAGRLKPGVYSWSANTALGDEDFKDAGSFVVEENLIEQSDLVARHDVLREIATESGGRFYNLREEQRLTGDLLNNPEAKAYQSLESNTASIMEKKWIFIIFLVLLALEWGLRKFFGRY